MFCDQAMFVRASILWRLAAELAFAGSARLTTAEKISKALVLK